MHFSKAEEHLLSPEAVPGVRRVVRLWERAHGFNFFTLLHEVQVLMPHPHIQNQTDCDEVGDHGGAAVT